MILFTLHHLFHALFDDRMTFVQINCLTALLGAIIYFLTYGYLVEYGLGLSKIIKDWWWHICVADVCVMAVIYRSYYGRTIIAELGVDTEDDHWDYNENKHRYREKKSIPVTSKKFPKIEHEPIDDDHPSFNPTPDIQEKINEAVKQGIYAPPTKEPEEIKDRIKNSLHLYVPDQSSDQQNGHQNDRQNDQQNQSQLKTNKTEQTEQTEVVEIESVSTNDDDSN